MVSTLVPGTNTYATRAEADTYLGDSPFALLWAVVTNDNKDRSLLTAFLLIQRQTWQGERTGGDAQVPAFPRTGLTSCDGVAQSSVTTPDDIKNGQIELAYAISQDPTIATVANSGSNTKRLQAGSASIEFFNSTDGSGGVTASRFPANVQELFRCYLAGMDGGGAESFGTCDRSIFDPCNSYDRNTPL